MPGFNTVLTASDETAAAFTSAENRQKKYRVAIAGADRELTRMRASMLGAGAASQALTGVLTGNVAALDNVGTSLAMVSPRLMKAGTLIAAVGVGWQLGRIIGDLDAVDKLLTKIGGQSLRDPTVDLGIAAERMSGMIGRRRMIAGAESEVEATDIAARTDKSGTARAVATAQADAERVRKEQQLAQIEAQNATAKAATAAASAQSKAGRFVSTKDREEIDKAEAALKEAQANEIALAEAAAKKIEAAQNRVTQAIKAGTEEAGKLATKLDDAAANATLDKAQQYKTTIDEAVSGIGDARTRKAALDLVNAPGFLRGNEREALLDKQAQVANIDKLAAMERERRDPAAQEQRRDLERVRKSTERAIRAAEEDVKAGRPLSKAQQQLLENKRALDDQAQRGKGLRAAELDVRERREAEMAKDIGRLLTEQQQINRELKTLLVTAS
jgi:hypothetical protein